MRERVAEVRLKHLVRDRDRHGNVRVYVRLPGQKKIRLRAAEGTEEFLEEYRTAVSGGGESTGKRRRSAKPGSMRALILHYQASRTFRDLQPSTRATRRRVLDRVDEKIGDHHHSRVTSAHVKTWRDAPDAPESGNHIVKVLRAVFTLAIEDGLAEHNPAAAVGFRRSANPDGYAAWSPEDVRKFVKAHPRGTMAHKALCIFLFTGQRLSDVRRLGPQHVKDRWLVFTQHKNRNRRPVKMELPIIKPLAQVLDDPPSHHLAFITSERGTPFQSDKSLGNRFVKWTREAGIEGKSAHGVRKGCASILASMGLTDRQIMAVTGHTTGKEVDRYTRAANRRLMAEAGLQSVEGALGLLTEQSGAKMSHSASGGVPPKRKAL